MTSEGQDDPVWGERLHLMFTAPHPNHDTWVNPSRDLPVNTMVEAQVAHLLDKWSHNPPLELEKVIKAVLTDAVSHMWREHMVNLDILTDSIGFRAYAQKNPQVEFASEGYTMFTNAVNATILDKAIEMAHADISLKPVEPEPALLNPQPLPELST